MIHNDEWQTENGFSLLKARDVMAVQPLACQEHPFVLLTATHLFDPSIVRTLGEQSLSNDEVLLAVDKDGKASVDMSELSQVNGFESSLMLCTPNVFDSLERARQTDHSMTLSSAIDLLAEQKLAKSMPTAGFRIDVDNENAYQKAENAIIESATNLKRDSLSISQ